MSENARSWSAGRMTTKDQSAGGGDQLSDKALEPAGLSLPKRTLAVRRAAARLCRALGWAPLHEVALPNGRRADILALRRDGDFACIEVKSGVNDFLSDGKWPDYREYSDWLYFAVDADFPLGLLPPDVGVIVTAADEAEMLRAAPLHRLAPARRTARRVCSIRRWTWWRARARRAPASSSGI